MASLKKTDMKALTLARIKRTEAYAERVRTLFAATVNQILALNKSVPHLDDGEMFSFDAESIKKQKEVERLLRQLHATATMAIERGIRLEWAQANTECDTLVKSHFGKSVLESPEFTAWTERNNAAMTAFINRSERGLNLSQRVWKSVRQLRDEMEVAITVSVGEGESAASMSRKVRLYLNDPDLMFRRFRYKDPESGEWKRKWKKRVKDPDTGKVTWIDYDKSSYKDQWTGAGYYKSSAQNAMRVARTETNIAYRRADNERWADMDFVIGQRVQLSRNHPKRDICDTLAGDYPKDFVFDGWHPQCFCFVTPILVEDDVMAEMNDAFFKGEDWERVLHDKCRKRQIKDYPDEFKTWVRDNEDNIIASRSRGSDPYFIRNNARAIDEILHPELKKLSPLEIAEKRHEARTPEDIEKIKLSWQERQERIAQEKAAAEAERIRVERINATANNVLGVVSSRFNGMNIDTSALTTALSSGDSSFIQSETRQLALALSAKQKQIKITAGNVAKVATTYGEIDIEALNKALKSGNIALINQETRSLAQSVLAMKKQEASLSNLIPDVHEWHKQFSMSELIQVHNAVKKKLADWSYLSDEELAKKLKFEAIDFLGGNMHGVQSKYATWKVSQSAYLKKLEEVNYNIAVKSAQQQISVLKAYIAEHPKATTISKAVSEAESLLSSGADMSLVKGKLDYAEKRKALQEKAAAKNAEKKAIKTTSEQFGDEAYTQERRDAAMWAKDTAEADSKLRANCGTVWKAASQSERNAIYGYTEEYHNINEPLRGLTYYGSETKAQRGLKRIPLIESIIDKSTYDFDMWLQRGDGLVALKKFGLSNYATATDDEIMALIGAEGVEGAFWSAGVAKGKGFSGSVIFNIYAPKGTKAMYCEPFSAFGAGSGKNWNGDDEQVSFGKESEILIQRGTKFRITKIKKDDSGTWFVDVDIIEQKPVTFPYVGGYPFK
ncbi:MAG: ADP-ribosyltransferase [Bacteroides sp.]|nr:ADP-ribosyltransferase [Bacteroides sp.]